MADLKTEITELVTGLGMCGYDDVAAALEARPASMVSVSPELWKKLDAAYAGGAYAREFADAFANGRAFLFAVDGLRGRLPLTIEWKGAIANPGDDVLPVDLRIDHVFLISCKYLSKVLHNASPTRVFDQLLATTGRGNSDWYAEVAPDSYREFYKATVEQCAVVDAPSSPADLSTEDRKRLQDVFPEQWCDEVEHYYALLCKDVAEASAARWSAAMSNKAEQEATLRRLLRFGHAPYFVLGSAPKDSLRLRIATPWDWKQLYSLQRLDVSPRDGGQPMVNWRATVKHQHSGLLSDIDGHVEIRWGHGRFGTKPEAKVYLDTPHAQVPGYFQLA